MSNLNLKIFNTIVITIVFVFYCTLSDSAEIPVNKKGADMETIKKTVGNIDRYKNNSTAPSAIKIQLKDKKTGQITNAVVRNDDFASFLEREQGLSLKDYVDYMVRNDGKPLEIDLAKFKKSLGKRWLGKASLGEKYFREYVNFETPMNFGQLNLASEEQFIQKYFDFNYTKGSGSLKKEYYEKYTRNPAFIALLIDLGYDASWGCIAPVLIISTTPSINEEKTQ